MMASEHLDFLAPRLEGIRRRMDAACDRADRDPADVELLAVSKRKPAEAVRAAYDLGLRHFGENYVQHWLDKAEHPLLVGLDDLRWHYIGVLQRNKVRFCVGRLHRFEAVDRLKTAQEIHKRAAGPQQVLIEVNLGAEDSKGGYPAASLRRELPDLLALDNVQVMGLMSLPPRHESPEATRPDHRALRELRDELQQLHGVALPELSMGMSADFEVAIEEGATRVRVGTLLFGERE